MKAGPRKILPDPGVKRARGARVLRTLPVAEIMPPAMKQARALLPADALFRCAGVGEADGDIEASFEQCIEADKSGMGHGLEA